MSSLTRTDIINLALREIGTDRISDHTESSPEADVARDVWEQALRMSLSRHQWTFAMEPARLARSRTAPAARYSYIYTLPGNFVRLGSISPSSSLEPPLIDYAMRASGIHTDATSVYIEYVQSDCPEGTWPPWFTDVFVVDLASLMASPLKSTTERERLEQLAQKRLATARSIDSQQKPPMRWREGSWVQAKRGGRGGNSNGGSSSSTSDESELIWGDSGSITWE
jgi:hypothetical protein